MKRINSAKDDPSGLVQVTKLEQALAAAETASQGVTRAGAILSTADTAAGEIVKQLQAARTLALEAAGGTLSASEVAGNQIQIDTILSAIDSAAQTEFGGRRLLDGSAGFRTSGADSAEVLDVDVVEKSTADDVTVSINVTSQATQAAATFTDGDGSLDADTTVIIDGPDGTTTISLTSGDSTQTITDAFNSVAAQTGITATRVDANQVDFQTADYGSDASISITDNVWEMASGPHNSNNHWASDEGDRLANGRFKYGPRAVDIRWSTFYRTDIPRRHLQHPTYCVVKVNNAFNNPRKPGEKRWVAFPRPQVIFQYFDGRTGELRYAESITAKERK